MQFHKAKTLCPAEMFCLAVGISVKVMETYVTGREVLVGTYVTGTGNRMIAKWRKMENNSITVLETVEVESAGCGLRSGPVGLRTVPSVGTAGWEGGIGSTPMGWGNALCVGYSLRDETVAWEWAIYRQEQ